MQETFPNFTQLDPAARAALSREVKRLAARCSTRDCNEEGIPTYLMLEDVTSPESSPVMGSVLHNTLLASAAELSLAALAYEEIGPKEIATVFELLALQLFTMNLAETAAVTDAEAR